MHNHQFEKNVITEDIHTKKVALVGNPNVGKSVIFGILTGKYVTVSNYPGTTVEVTRGITKISNSKITLVDTPGTNSLIPMSEDEKVTRDILLEEKISLVIQVADSKNVKRALHISIQLAEAEIPFELVLNMTDEANSRGIRVDGKKLSTILGIPVHTTVATRRQGVDKIGRSIEATKLSKYRITYDEEIEYALEKISVLLPETYISRRTIALMILTGDDTLQKWLTVHLDQEAISKMIDIRREVQTKYRNELGYVITQRRMKYIDSILTEVYQVEEHSRFSFSQKFGQAAMHRYWGLITLVIILYGVFWLVGLFGSVTAVDFLETVAFGQYISPFSIKVADFLFPFSHTHTHHVVTWTLQIPLTSSHSWNTGIEFIRGVLSSTYILSKGTHLSSWGQVAQFFHDFFVGQYGAITMALSYGFAIVLPIVGTFFIAFGILEDSGYLPRLAVMVNKIFKLMGLNGKAVLPMMLGLGCDTMATMTTRILESKKERIIVTLLLALGVPCSAQLGVILGMLSVLPARAIFVWIGVVTGVMLLVGLLAAKVIPGRSSDFVLELPPIRVPQLANIFIKTMARIEWYLREVVPLFILGTAFLFFFDKLNLLVIIQNFAAPLVQGFLGLPARATEAFLIGFLRRDYGAAGLFDLTRNNLLNHVQIVVSLVTITLFVPCIANVFMMIKERGMKTAMWMVAFIFPFAFFVGGVLNWVLKWMSITF